MCARLRSLVFLLSFALAGPGLAQIEDARRAYGDLNYEGCKAAAAIALKEPAGKIERVETYKLAGLCAAALGDTEAARSAFMKMLAINPEATLPPGLSPRFTSSYLEAKGEWVGKVPLGLELFGEKLEGSTRVLRLIVRDEADIVARVVWEDEDGERGPPLVAAEKMEIEVPAALTITLFALDEHEGIVASLPLGTGVAPEPKETALQEETPAVVIEEEEGAPWLVIGVAVGAGALIAAGGAAALGVYLAQPRDLTLESQVVFGNQ